MDFISIILIFCYGGKLNEWDMMIIDYKACNREKALRSPTVFGALFTWRLFRRFSEMGFFYSTLAGNPISTTYNLLIKNFGSDLSSKLLRSATAFDWFGKVHNHGLFIIKPNFHLAFNIIVGMQGSTSVQVVLFGL
jgi:hypothetical protein